MSGRCQIKSLTRTARGTWEDSVSQAAPGGRPCPVGLLRRRRPWLPLPPHPGSCDNTAFSGTDSVSRPCCLMERSDHTRTRQVRPSPCPAVIPFFFLLPFPSVLYPNLAELENYMGLSLSSQEVQQNLPQILEGASVGIHLLTGVGTAVPAPPPWSCHANGLESPLPQPARGPVS